MAPSDRKRKAVAPQKIIRYKTFLMRTIARLFGKSLFAPLQSHMSCVMLCIEKLTEIISINPAPQKLVDELCQHKQDANMTKNDLQNNFSKIDKSRLLEILALQDSIADLTQQIGVTLSLRPLSKPLLPALAEFYLKNVDTFICTQHLIHDIDSLIENDKAHAIIEQTARKEQESRHLERILKQKICSITQEWSPSEFYIWMHLIDQIGHISVLSEKLASRVRMVLD